MCQEFFFFFLKHFRTIVILYSLDSLYRLKTIYKTFSVLSPKGIKQLPRLIPELLYYDVFLLPLFYFLLNFGLIIYAYYIITWVCEHIPINIILFITCAERIIYFYRLVFIPHRCCACLIFMIAMIHISTRK